jgi:hypothetical protein
VVNPDQFAREMFGGRRRALSRSHRLLRLRAQIHDATIGELGPQDSVLGQQHLVDRSKAINVRRIFSRFEKLDVMFLGFISFALIADGLRMC